MSANTSSKKWNIGIKCALGSERKTFSCLPAVRQAFVAFITISLHILTFFLKASLIWGDFGAVKEFNRQFG